jgi:hypothetical protein
MLFTSTLVDPTGSVLVAEVQTPPLSVSNKACVSTPPLSVYEPAATQYVIVRQEIEFSSAETAPTGAGTVVSAVQVPPVIVSMRTLVGGDNEPNEPTAMHEVIDAHHTPLSSGAATPWFSSDGVQVDEVNDSISAS